MNQSAIQAKAEMLIRRPVAETFAAFIDPDLTTKFWFTKSSGPVEQGKQLHWEWEMYNASTPVTVQVVETNKRILIEWSGPDAPNRVEWVFTPLGDNSTFVSITNSGFHGDEASQFRQALDSTEAFAMVLAGAKAWLEHGIYLNLVADRFPTGLA